MINLREMKNELDALIEEREAMCENPDITMDEQSDMDWRIEEQYRDIADIFLNDEDIMKAAQEILDKKAKAYIVNVKIVSLDLRDTEGDNINEDYLWHGEEAPVIGQRVLAENCYFITEAIIINVEETTMEEVEDMELVSDAYKLEEAYLPVVKVVYGGDYTNEIYAVWNEQGAMENGEWNDRDLPRAGCICALRLGYKNYVEGHIYEITEMSEYEIEELKEKETVYKAYDYDRMVLQRYGFDPDEEGKPEE